MSVVKDTETALIASIVIASILAVSSVSVTIFVILRFLKHTEDVLKYFSYCTMFTLICGMLTSSFNMAFCISEHVDSYNWFIHGPKWWTHQSFILRLIVTCLWYLQKIGLFFIFNGRLYYGFVQSNYAVPKSVFLSLNILTPVIAIVTLSVGYYALIMDLSETLINFGFQSFRVWWIIMSLLFIVLFNVRLISVCAKL